LSATGEPSVSTQEINSITYYREADIKCDKKLDVVTEMFKN